MAGEIGHVVYGNLVAEKLEVPIDSKAAFWSGTLFPDIRHIDAVSRHRTHPEDVSLSSLVGVSDFHTGMRIHSWIDGTREAFLSRKNIKEVLPWHPFVPHALKLLEDEQVYAECEDWDDVTRALHTVHDVEKEFVVDVDTIEQWHVMLRDYFSQFPTDESRVQLANAIGLSSTLAKEINTVVRRLREHRVAKLLSVDFKAHLLTLLR